MKNKINKLPERYFLSYGLAIGIPIGSVIGLFIGNIAIGPVIGVGMGYLFGMIWEKKAKDDGRLRKLTKKEMTQKKKILKNVLMFGLVTFSFVVIAYLTGPFAYKIKQNQENQSVEKYRASLSGEYLCLPTEIVNDIQMTESESKHGIKTDEGEYFAIDFMLMSQIPPKISEGDWISANGMVVPAELLSVDFWDDYPIEGVFSVTDSVKKLEK